MRGVTNDLLSIQGNTGKLIFILEGKTEARKECSVRENKGIYLNNHCSYFLTKKKEQCRILLIQKVDMWLGLVMSKPTVTESPLSWSLVNTIWKYVFGRIVT